MSHINDPDGLVEQAMVLLREVTPAQQLERIEFALQHSWGVDADCAYSRVFLYAGSGGQAVEVEIDVADGSVTDYTVDPTATYR